MGWKTSAVVLLVAFYVVKSFLHQRRVMKKYREQYGLKSITPVPILGDIPYMIMTGGLNGAVIRTLDRHRKLGPVFLSFYFDHPTIEVAHPELLKIILTSKYSIYDRSIFEQTLFDELLGGGLILRSNGEVWKSHRQMLTHGFHQSKMISSVGDIATKAARFLDKLPIGAAIDIQDEFQRLTFDIMCSFSLGVNLEEVEQARGISVAKLWYDVLDHTQARFIALFPYWRFYETPAVKRYNEGMKTLKELINQAIDAELVRQKNGNSEGQSLLSSMVTQFQGNPEAFGREDIIQHALTFLFAGHDTTTNLLTFMAYHIGKDPVVKRNCVEEVDAMFEGKSADYLPTFADIKGLRYLRMVAKETLRLYPGAPLRGRVALEDDLLGDDGKIFIEKGMTVFLDFLSSHLNPEYYPDPEKFDPERFSEENESKRPLHHFLPFGFGPRRCIGEQFAMNEATTVMSMILRRVDIESLPENQIVRELTLTMRSKYGVKVVLRKK